MKWTTACPDWERRIVTGQSLVPFAPLFPQEAADAMAVFRELLLVDAAGSPKLGDTCRPWVFDFVNAIFGAYDHSTGRRYINEFFLLISKKNGKSSIAAGIMITALLRNWREGAEFIIVAPSLKAADNAADAALLMVERDPELQELLYPKRYNREILHKTTGATLRVISAEGGVVVGNKATGVLIDELHEFGRNPNGDRILREARGGLAARPEGFVIALSTQSSEPPAGVFKAWLNRYRDIRDGKKESPGCLGVLYEFPSHMLSAGAHMQPENFYVTNPNLGLSVDTRFLLDEYDKAQQAGEASVKDFLAKHLNVEIGLNLRNDRWTAADFWEACAEPGLTFEDLLERCEVCAVGIDNGGVDDLFGLAVVGREAGTGRWLLWAHAFAHQKAFERRQSEAAKYMDFLNDGDLTKVTTQYQACQMAAEYAVRVMDAGKLAKVAADTYGLADIKMALVEAGIPEDTIGYVAQGYRLNGVIRGAEAKIVDGQFLHGGTGLMNYCMSNVKAVLRGNNIVIEKQQAGTSKIDPVLAMLNACAVMATNPAAMNSNEVWAMSC